MSRSHLAEALLVTLVTATCFAIVMVAGRAFAWPEDRGWHLVEVAFLISIRFLNGRKPDGNGGGS